MTDDTSSNVNSLDEWKEIRSMIDKYDGFLDGLRKYGFSFIALLLTASAIKEFIALNLFTKIAINILIIFFTISLYLFDRYYQQLIKTTVIRQRILETILNIEIGYSTNERFKKDQLEKSIIYLYAIFILIEAIFGYTSAAAVAYTNNTSAPVNNSITTTAFNTNLWLLLLWVTVALIGLFFIVIMSNDKFKSKYNFLKIRFFKLDLNPEGNAPHDYKEDWIIDKVSCNVGDKVRITITNIGEEVIDFSERDENGRIKVCDIYSQGVVHAIVHTIYTQRVTVKSYNNYSWLWDTDSVAEGIYEINPRSWKRPLRAYPKSPAALNVIHAHAKCNIAR